MTLIILSFYVVLSSIKNEALGKFLSLDNTVTFIFLLWMLTGGLSFSFHGVFGADKTHCLVEDKLVSLNFLILKFINS
jgi:hypothetical protein